jgi:hypothetical protein
MRSKTLFTIPIIFAFAFTLSISVYSQKSTVVSGIVTTYNSFPLNNVLIKSHNTGVTKQSDSLGHFTINCGKNDILLFSASGFDDKSVRIRKSQDISINLVYSNNQTSFNDAISDNHISADDLQKGINRYGLKGVKDYSRYTSIFQLINTEISNVKVVGTSVLTKKVQSFSLTSQVMYVVDDIVIMDISTILPSEVKSIKYVDGVGAAVYGSNGANGVIVITLKR